MADGGRQTTEHGALPDPNSERLTPNSELRAPGYNIINLGGGNRPITINAMIALIEKELNAAAGGALWDESSSLLGSGTNNQQPPTDNRGAPPPPFQAVIDRRAASAADMTDTQADITKAGRLLGWKPEVTPEEGFRRTVAWYLANRAWLRDVRL